MENTPSAEPSFENATGKCSPPSFITVLVKNPTNYLAAFILKFRFFFFFYNPKSTFYGWAVTKVCFTSSWLDTFRSQTVEWIISFPFLQPSLKFLPCSCLSSSLYYTNVGNLQSPVCCKSGTGRSWQNKTYLIKYSNLIFWRWLFIIRSDRVQRIILF